jgi:hypothetical protein
VEFKAIAEIFFRSSVLCRHKGPAFRTSHSDTVADVTWLAITSWVRSNESQVQNSVHYLLPYRKKNQFKAYGVKKDIPTMEMLHHQEVTVESSTHLLAAQREIETLRIQLWNVDATIRGYMRMVEGQDSDLYVSDTHLVSHLLSPGLGQGACSEQPLPLWISQSLGVTRVSNRVVLLIICLMIEVCVCACLVGVVGCFSALSTTSSILR